MSLQPFWSIKTHKKIFILTSSSSLKNQIFLSLRSSPALRPLMPRIVPWEELLPMPLRQSSMRRSRQRSWRFGASASCDLPDSESIWWCKPQNWVLCKWYFCCVPKGFHVSEIFINILLGSNHVWTIRKSIKIMLYKFPYWHHPSCKISSVQLDHPWMLWVSSHDFPWTAEHPWLPHGATSSDST